MSVDNASAGINVSHVVDLVIASVMVLVWYGDWFLGFAKWFVAGTGEAQELVWHRNWFVAGVCAALKLVLRVCDCMGINNLMLRERSDKKISFHFEQ